MSHLVLALLIASLGHALPLLREPNRPCLVPENSDWVAYSGYRIQYESRWPVEALATDIDQFVQLRLGRVPESPRPPLGSKTNDSLVVTLCDMGHVVRETHRQFDSSWNALNLPWNQTFCTTDPSSHTCYRLARRKSLVRRNLPLYATRSIVGGLFRDNSSFCTPDSSTCRWTPVSPLIADHWSARWTYLSVPRHLDFELVHRVPLFYTPDQLDHKYPRSPQWAQFVDPYENYSFAHDPRTLRQRLLDTAARLGHSRLLLYVNHSKTEK